jgi:MFS family permease
MMAKAARGSAAVLAAGFVILFIGGGSRFIIGLTLKPMVEELAWSRGTLGLAVAVFMVVSALFMFVAGRLSDRFSVKLILGSGLALSGLGLGLMGLVSAPWHVLVLYGGVFAVGAGLASLTPVAVMVTRWFSGRAGLANAFATSGMAAGQLVMIAVMAYLITQIGWRWVYGSAGLAMLATTPLLMFWIRQSDLPAEHMPAGHGQGFDLTGAARTKRFWLLNAVYAICGFQDFFVATHVVAFAQDNGAGQLLAGNLLAAMGLTSLVGVMLAGWWSDRSGPVPATIVSFAIRTAAFALVVINRDVVSIAIFALAFGFTFLITAPFTVIFTRDAFGYKHLGALSGLITMVHHIAGGLGAYLGAALFDLHGDYALSIQIMLVLSALGMILTKLVRLPARAGR